MMDILSEIIESNDSFPEFSDEDIEELSVLFSSDSSSYDSGSDNKQHADVVLNFMDTIHSFSNNDFKRHFRMNRNTVSELIEMYEASIPNQQPGGRQCAAREIHIFLWFMGNRHTFYEVGNLFGISKSAAWNVVVKVCSWIISIGHNYIKWPTANDITYEMSSWEENTKIPNVIGAIDCSHIKIKAPSENKTSYFNRKHYYSIQLQAVVDYKKQFTDIFIGEAGSLHDSRVLRKSELFNEAQTNKEILFPNNAVLLGDSSYPLLDWLIPPFQNNGNLTNVATQFNALHSSAIIKVTNAFGMLKTRFRRLLHFSEQTNIKLIVNLTVAGCILHNICINQNDNFEEELQPEPVDESNQIPQPEDNKRQSNRRQAIIDYLISKRIIIP